MQSNETGALGMLGTSNKKEPAEHERLTPEPAAAGVTQVKRRFGADKVPVLLRASTYWPAEHEGKTVHGKSVQADGQPVNAGADADAETSTPLHAPRASRLLERQGVQTCVPFTHEYEPVHAGRGLVQLQPLVHGTPRQSYLP